ncbi:hypothetical protein BKP64_13785 [Marinobacter salinus]|uniref:EAL domain-containing protein n=1 Tax=Marinobacter salinus TaxID=1874317 RepID=A0A1D9GNP9_9GAMM|nr:EAL domain-containing protein [Marinobacter salinus]AOY89151.1 hypothetical protein BKP64_13785 [Marinobacter salinus]
MDVRSTVGLDDNLLIGLALDFAESSSVGIDPAIDGFLRKVGLAIGGHRSYLFLIDRNTLTLSNTHEWCATGVTPQKDEAGVPVGAEALIRWECPSRGRVPPVNFIPLAEETGLIEHFGRPVAAGDFERAVVMSE